MTIKILAVDDMSQWRNFHSSALSTIFEDLGKEFEITVKNSATEAFQDVSENLTKPYDLIISDLQMENDYEPEHAGEWFVRNVKELKQYKTRPVLIVSAAWNVKFIASKLNADYLSKTILVKNPLTYSLKIKELLF